MRKTSQITIFVFAALLVALPMASSGVFAQVSVGSADLEGSCGITPPTSIDLGSLDAGSDGVEKLMIITTDGTVDSTLTVIANDWIGADGEIHLEADVTKFAISLDENTNADVSYTNKVNLGTNGTSFTLSDSVTPAHDVKLYLQLSAVGEDILKNMPYSGTLQQTLTFESTCPLA